MGIICCIGLDSAKQYFPDTALISMERIFYWNKNAVCRSGKSSTYQTEQGVLRMRRAELRVVVAGVIMIFDVEGATAGLPFSGALGRKAEEQIEPIK